jgi:hypothetical protein
MMVLILADTIARRKQLVNTEAKEMNSRQLCHAPIVDLAVSE